MSKIDKSHLHGIVDMGSNAIRFSITDMSPRTARIMPTVFQTRCGISLFDAQYSQGTKRPIPAATIDRVIAALAGFKRSCVDFGVPPPNVRIIATEATRLAINSAAFREAIERATGWPVEMLPKEEEGRVGALGVASSFHEMAGLALDLGGGSVQIAWVVVKAGVVETSAEGAVSLPYGAAAVTRSLLEAEKQALDQQSAEGERGSGKERLERATMIQTAGRERMKKELETAMMEDWKAALSKLKPPPETRSEDGYRLYLSGGGFRGWGYLLMNAHPVQPYPIANINGFESPGSAFPPEVLFSVGPGRERINNSIFGISTRRASQVPAVELLITSLLSVLGPPSTIRFAEGGVRDGIHYATLPPETRREHPLVVATRPHAPGSPESTAHLVHLLRQTVPQDTHEAIPPFLQHDHHIRALIHLLSFHAPVPKEVRPSAALRCTTSGLLAGVHGLSHADRAILALALFHRWDGELPPADRHFLATLEQLVGGPVSWWCRYLGVVAGWIGDRYPAGRVPERDRPREHGATADSDVGTDAVRAGERSATPGGVEAEMLTVEAKDGSQVGRVVLRGWPPGGEEDVEENAKSSKLRMSKLGREKNWGLGLDGTQRWGLDVLIMDP